NLFFQTWPGWTWGRYEHRKLYAEHRFLADMLSVTSTFTGHLATAEAIYDGPANNLVGIQTFSGGKDSASPQHAVLLGMSGAGKSVTVCDLLTQTEGYFGYTVIIEEGLSYGIYTATVEEGARPIIIHPDGDLTINYLDTKGLPLTPDHMSAATALVARMIGTSAQEDKQMLRQAQIAKYINLLYEDPTRTGRRNGTISCSSSPGTHSRSRSFVANGCRPAQPALKRSPTSATGELPTPTKLRHISRSSLKPRR
ncbi:MAG TPA: hypothetical protein PKO46_23305, partial [Sedimentisphaerales bacterium]|nr:hypothetical protein [Sedimentisphaerales bacterium]